MSQTRVAPKDYRCQRCGGVILAGQPYRRRSEHNGIHYTANKYHPECEELKIKGQ